MGAGANLVSLADWRADTERLVGFARGAARSAKANRVWKQSSFITSAIAQMIMQRTGLDMRDDNDIAGFITKLERGITLLSPHQPITGNTTFFVDGTNGSDGNDGRTQATAKRTIQAAIENIEDNIDADGNQITIKVSPGTYAGFYLITEFEGQEGVPLVIEGEPSNPSACVINSSAIHPVVGINFGACACAFNGAKFDIQGFRLLNAGGGCIRCDSNATVRYRNIDFGQCTDGHIVTHGGTIRCLGNYTISGSAIWHMLCQNFAFAWIGGQPINIQMIGNPGFGEPGTGRGAFCAVGGFSACEWVDPRPTFTGNVGAGSNHNFTAVFFAWIRTDGAGTNYFPGPPADADPSTFGLYT